LSLLPHRGSAAVDALNIAVVPLTVLPTIIWGTTGTFTDNTVLGRVFKIGLVSV
jgi:hypothetical protein